jgi:molecular chaperone DnaJ
MSKKNYYQLLHVSPQATAQEIKAAYRKLAFKYHPDRNKGNTLTEAVLKEINEAYRVLSNPEKRRFYNASIAINNFHPKHKRPTPITSHAILQNAIKLKTYVERSNVLNINQDIVFHKVQSLLSEHHLNILLLENNIQLIHQFIQQLLLCMQPLTSKSIQLLLAPLQKLAAGDENMLEEIQTFYQQKKGDAFWQRYKMVAVLIVALLLCLLMYLL